MEKDKTIDLTLLAVFIATIYFKFVGLGGAKYLFCFTFCSLQLSDWWNFFVQHYRYCSFSCTSSAIIHDRFTDELSIN